MMKRGLYAKHRGIHCRFWESGNSYVLQTDYSEELLSKGFKKYDDIELKDKVYKEVAFIDIESAFEVSTFCTYKGFKFFVESILDKGIYVIRPLAEAQIHFKDFERHGYDPVYEVEESEIEEVWEERKPIDEFLFDTEPIVYIKKIEKIE
ncbi:guanylate kinase [Flavobacterium quisquiliarum]|uniref:Guanylate kinase n=1 Tax=Flavobacterium quisquiliarum TaxID=1834436 RepID=A0ABV8VZ33_9FLAO|nr:guanylate kinase [Flavobacterium quisquiliarum]MBW1654735.1 guanylate kinase [Flavobacterium quisquiliarum]NWL01579.1 guanylate kinase [Flavobacterium collinsii]